MLVSNHCFSSQHVVRVDHARLLCKGWQLKHWKLKLDIWNGLSSWGQHHVFLRRLRTCATAAARVTVGRELWLQIGMKTLLKGGDCKQDYTLPKGIKGIQFQFYEYIRTYKPNTWTKHVKKRAMPICVQQSLFQDISRKNSIEWPPARQSVGLPTQASIFVLVDRWFSRARRNPATNWIDWETKRFVAHLYRARRLDSWLAVSNWVKDGSCDYWVRGHLRSFRFVVCAEALCAGLECRVHTWPHLDLNVKWVARILEPYFQTTNKLSEGREFSGVSWNFHICSTFYSCLFQVVQAEMGSDQGSVRLGVWSNWGSFQVMEDILGWKSSSSTEYHWV